MFMSRGLSLWGLLFRSSTVGISMAGGVAFCAALSSANRVAWAFITSMAEGLWAPRYACNAKPAGKTNKKQTQETLENSSKD